MLLVCVSFHVCVCLFVSDEALEEFAKATKSIGLLIEDLVSIGQSFHCYRILTVGYLDVFVICN